jgi:hypothetical protein
MARLVDERDAAGVRLAEIGQRGHLGDLPPHVEQLALHAGAALAVHEEQVVGGVAELCDGVELGGGVGAVADDGAADVDQPAGQGAVVVVVDVGAVGRGDDVIGWGRRARVFLGERVEWDAGEPGGVGAVFDPVGDRVVVEGLELIDGGLEAAVQVRLAGAGGLGRGTGLGGERG